MKLYQLFEIQNPVSVPVGNWFNARTGQHIREYKNDDPLSPTYHEEVGHAETISKNWKAFGFTDEDDARDQIGDGFYAKPYNDGWVRYFFYEDLHALMCTSIMKNFESRRGKLQLHRLAVLVNVEEMMISDMYNSSKRIGRWNPSTFEIYLDVQQLKDHGRFVDRKTDKEIMPRLG